MSELLAIKKELDNINAQYSKQKIERLTVFAALSCLVVLLSAFLLTLLGVIDLRYVSEVELHPLINFSLSTSLFMLNMYFVFSITLDVYDNKVFKYLLWYLPILIVPQLIWEVHFIMSSILPLVFLLCIKPKKQTCITYIKLFLLTSFIQVLLLFVKTHEFNPIVTHHNSVTTMVYSIDLILVLYFIRKVAINHGLACKLDIYAEIFSILKTRRPSEKVLDFDELTKRQQILFLTLASGYQIMQLLVVLALGLIGNMFLELVVMLAMFWCGRKILGASWHSNTLWLCSVATFSGFFILIRISLPAVVSLFCVVILSSLFVYVLHALAIAQSKLEQLDKLYNECFAKHEFTTFDDFDKYKFTNETQEIAYKWKVLKLTGKEILADYPHLTIDSLKVRKNRINAKIKEFNAKTT